MLAVYADVAVSSSSCPPLRDCLAALGDARVRVEVQDIAVGVDLDTPEDVVALSRAGPIFWASANDRGKPRA
jgi:hypothetical protein